MKKALILFLFVLACGCSSDSEKSCKTNASCLSDPNCLCWCSQSCSFRKKEKTDNPTWVDGDPKGKFCYCKEWDVDFMKENCPEVKAEQPKGAK
jgi:hypothetical protein